MMWMNWKSPAGGQSALLSYQTQLWTSVLFIYVCVKVKLEKTHPGVRAWEEFPFPYTKVKCWDLSANNYAIMDPKMKMTTISFWRKTELNTLTW